MASKSGTILPMSGRYRYPEGWRRMSEQWNNQRGCTNVGIGEEQKRRPVASIQ
jgi:hypothetical protein